MLSLFPSFFSLQPLAPFLLRVTLGAVLLYWCYSGVKRKENATSTIFALIDGVAGLFLVLGLFMQLGALISLLVLLGKIIKKIRTRSFFTDGVNYYFILFIISLSLLFLGPGAFAFDLPL